MLLNIGGVRNLYYGLDDGLQLQFDIRDFIQTNADLNRQMITTALDWLSLHSQDHVLDLFCGMGNFTLPLAKRVKSAVGIEGVFDMVQKSPNEYTVLTTLRMLNFIKPI